MIVDVQGHIGLYEAGWKAVAHHPPALAAAHDDPARDAAAAVSGRTGPHLIGALMHDKGGPVAIEQGGGPGLEVHAGIGELEVAMTCSVHGDVGEIARERPARLLGAPLRLLRVEVGTSGVEVRRITSCHLVDVDGFRARLDTLEIEQDTDSVIFL